MANLYLCIHPVCPCLRQAASGLLKTGLTDLTALVLFHRVCGIH